MTARSRQLGGVNPPPPTSKSPPSLLETFDIDSAVMLGAFLGALILVLCFVVVASCDWIRRRLSGGTPAAAEFALPRRSAANKGLKKKVMKSLPKVTYGEGGDHTEKLTDCAICLSNFAAGEEIRVLPQCGHGYHVGCIDTWLGSHSSCPSCRQVLPCGYQSSAAVVIGF